MLRAAIVVLGVMSLSPGRFWTYEKLVLPTDATYSPTTGCIEVHKGRDEDGQVLEEDVQICNVHFFQVIP